MRLAHACRCAMLVALALLAMAGRAQTASDEEVPFITTPTG